MATTTSDVARRIRAAALAVVWLAVAGALPVTAAATPVVTTERQIAANLVPNPGFEQAACGDTPILCGWRLEAPSAGGPTHWIGRSMSQDTSRAHSGSASMYLHVWDDNSSGFAWVQAGVDPAVCVPLIAGGHPASFWHTSFLDGGGVVFVSLGAVFYETADCTEDGRPDSISSSPSDSDWQRTDGVLVAPEGTQSARFNVLVIFECDSSGGCGGFANIDDLTVEDTVVSTPAIKSFSPPSGPVGTSVEILGINFAGASAVTFNGIAAAFTVESDTEIHATVPAAATTGPISIDSPDRTTTTSNAPFRVAPTITSFTPTCGPSGTSVRILGTHFAGATEVSFGSARASFTVDSDSEIHAIVPASWPLGPIAVTTPGGTGTSTSSFSGPCNAPPILIGFTPNNGPPGTSVQIFGYNFMVATSATFNGASAAFTVESDTTIHATVPNGATTGPISVTNPHGTGRTSYDFTVTAPSPTPTPTPSATPSPTPIPSATPSPSPSPTSTPSPTGCTATNGTDVPIPDRATVESLITISGCAGNASPSATVEVHIIHTHIGDLVVNLIAPDGSAYVLHKRSGGSTDNLDRTYTVNLSSEPANGPWKLRVRDAAAADIGRIDSWTISL
jgi:hypothetical protein